MFGLFRARSVELEHIDKGDYTPAEYEGCLSEMRRVNRFLGDTRAVRKSLLREIKGRGLEEFSVLDVGAGSGELLRVMAQWAREQGKQTRLVGVELNARSAQAIVEESRAFAEISVVRSDALHLPFAEDTFDYAICSLFTHHFCDEMVVMVLSEMARVARRQIFVVDLHRHPVAYYFYTTIGRIFLRNRLIREDGALSILRSFVPAELNALAISAGLQDQQVARRFPYRLVLRARKEAAVIRQS